MSRVRWRGVLWGAALAGAAAAVGHAAMQTEAGADADRELFRQVNRGHGPGPDRFFGGVTELGSLYAAAAAAGTMGLLGRRRAAGRALAAAAATWALGQVVKKAIDRPRPYEDDPAGTRKMIAEPAGTSWPSSHPAVLTSFTRVAALDLSVAASRVYLGVHYPGDVVSGLLMGRAVARIWPRRR